MILDPAFLSGFTLILTGFTGAFLAAIWVALVVWTYRDIRARARDRLVHILAAALVVILNLPGVLVYLVLRPPRTLEEEYQQTLEEEALLQTCQTKLLKPCHQCDKLMELSWNICPFCGTPVPGMRKESGTLDEAVSILKDAQE
jgi:hypothetical protein